MFLWDNDKKKCCGCGACVQICPKNCIHMEQDEDGFLVPAVTRENCVDCRLCEKVCPMVCEPEPEDRLPEQALCGFMARDEDYRVKSASGGAFGKLAETIFAEEESPVCVWGAAFSDDMKVSHVCACSEEELEPLRKSKYVQSDLKDTFSAIYNQLREGKCVAFSGTPCQVAGLRNYLKLAGPAPLGKLLCIDLACRGVPSQKAFDDYLAYEREKNHREIVSFSFRHKKVDEKGRKNSRAVLFRTDEGAEFQETKKDNPYLKFYYTSMGNRESCYVCSYAKSQRVGDLTIKDFWSVKNYYPEFDVHDGVSIIMANTVKGRSILEKLAGREDVRVLPVDAQTYLSNAANSRLKKPAARPGNRDKFFRIWRTRSFAQAVKQCCSPTLTNRVKGLAKRMLFGHREKKNGFTF